MSTFRCGMLILLLGSSQVLIADTLDQVYQLALENDTELKAAQAQFRGDSEAEKQAFGALLPQINAQVEFQDIGVDSTGTRTLDGSTEDSTRDSRNEGYSITLSQKLFDLNAWFNFKSGKAMSEQAAAKLAANQQSLIVRVAEAYFEVLRAQDNLTSIQAEEKAIKRQLEQTQQRFDVGLIAITDVHEARARYDLALVNRLNAQGQLGIAKEALTVITSTTHQTLGLLDERFPVLQPNPLERKAWEDFALKNNLEIKAMQAAADAALLNAQASKAHHYPTVNANLSYQDLSQDTDTVGGFFDSASIDSGDKTQTIAVTLSIPLFSGGSTSALRRQAYEQYNAAREGHIGMVRNTIQATRSLHLLVTTDVARVQARKQSIVSSQSARDATQAGYEVGTRNVVEVLDAQRTLFAARRDYATARYDYVLNLLRLKKQAGILSPKDITDISQWLVMNKQDSSSSSLASEQPLALDRPLAF